MFEVNLQSLFWMHYPSSFLQTMFYPIFLYYFIFKCCNRDGLYLAPKINSQNGHQYYQTSTITDGFSVQSFSVNAETQITSFNIIGGVNVGIVKFLVPVLPLFIKCSDWHTGQVWLTPNLIHYRFYLSIQKITN